MNEADANESGTWVTIELGYVDPQRRSCALCGRPLARRIWRERIAGNTLDFCNPDHVARYHSYWVPLYGAQMATCS